MTQGNQFGLSATQKIAMWPRWKAGQSLHEIGRAFGKGHSSFRCVVSHHGGFVPALRQRSLLALTLTEREEISRGIGGVYLHVISFSAQPHAVPNLDIVENRA